MPVAITDHEFPEALKHITTAAGTQTKKNHSSLKSSLDVVRVYAEEIGLANNELTTLIEAITRGDLLDQTSQNALMKSLYPAEKVPFEIVCIVVGSLGHGTQKASMATQQSLIQWLIKISDFLEEMSILTKFYSVLFNILNLTNLRADLCNLLTRITQKKHVKPFRIQMLQDLSATVGPEPDLLKLMFVYNQHAPGTLDLGKGNKPLGDISYLDPEWVLQLSRIQSRCGSLPASTDVKDYVGSLEKVKLSDLKPADMGDRIMQRTLALIAEDKTQSIIDECFSPVFNGLLEKMSSRQERSRSLSSTLGIFASLTRYTKTIPNAGLSFLERYLPKWDGLQNQATILELLSYLPIKPFSDLQRTILEPLETAILSTTDTPHITLLNFYTTLLRTWTARLHVSPPPTPLRKDTLTALTTHITPLTLKILTTNPSQAATSAILNYQTHLLPLIRPPLSLPLAPPKPLAVYLILFTNPSLSILSQISSTMANYKTIFETSTHPRPTDQIPQLNGTLIDTCNLLFRSRAFNSTDAHALGCLLSAPIVSKLAEYTAALDPPQPLTSLFSLSHNPTLAALSIAAFREIEEMAVEEGGEAAVKVRHAGPITQKSLASLGREGGVKMDWKEYRVAVLRWLEGIGAGGVRELGGATMKGLLGGPETPVGAKAGVAA